tara:strand:- start:1006 stop:1761 length:756 start_codon:yes stop_codon:yes gene_type:complete
MAFLGDFGRFFLGGATTADVGASAGSFIGGSIGGAEGAVAGASLGRSAGQLVGNIGTADQPDAQSALPTPPPSRPADLGAQETNTSGTNIINIDRRTGLPNQAGLGSLFPLIAQGAKLLGSRGGQIATGVGTGVGLSMFGESGQEKKALTQSRRNKSKVRQLVNFMGIEGTADFLSQQGGRNISPNDVVALLLRTFRNDGAFITKAQVRNLRRTTNRFKSLEKQVKEAVSIGTTRRPPVRRTVNRSTSIKI